VILPSASLISVTDPSPLPACPAAAESIIGMSSDIGMASASAMSSDIIVPGCSVVSAALSQAANASGAASKII
jgi:hypothetical protein